MERVYYKKVEVPRYRNYKEYFLKKISENANTDIAQLWVPVAGWLAAIFYFSFYYPISYLYENDTYYKKIKVKEE